MITTSAINAVGSAGYVEFWVNPSSLIAPNGWTFQVSSDGGSFWTTRLSELTGNNHTFQLYHYDLTQTERVASLKLRFQFVGYNAVAPTPAPKINLDDITVVTTSGTAPVSLTMSDDGLHGDGLAGDGIYGAQIPPQSAGTVVNYTLTATDSLGASTTTTTASSYTVNATTPNLNFIATVARVGNGVVLQWPAQAGFSYSVQWSDDLIQWSNAPVGQTNTWTENISALNPSPRRFYRVLR
jgi:hypothetical protein